MISSPRESRRVEPHSVYLVRPLDPCAPLVLLTSATSTSLHPQASSDEYANQELRVDVGQRRHPHMRHARQCSPPQSSRPTDPTHTPSSATVLPVTRTQPRLMPHQTHSLIARAPATACAPWRPPCNPLPHASRAAVVQPPPRLSRSCRRTMLCTTAAAPQPLLSLLWQPPPT